MSPITVRKYFAESFVEKSDGTKSCIGSWMVSDSGMDFKIADESGQNITKLKEELMSKESLSFTLHNFPL